MQDALISPEGISILTGAGIMEADGDKPIYVHCTGEIPCVDANGNAIVTVADSAITMAAKNFKDIAKLMNVEKFDPDSGSAESAFGFYAMLKDENGNIISEPFSSKATGAGKITVTPVNDETDGTIEIDKSTAIPGLSKTVESLAGYSLFLDYYEKKTSGAFQIDITADKFGGYFYVEASTLFRDQKTGRDDPAEFIIPNAKVQSNFTFSMASSGDPSAFDFTLDAFPGRVKGTTKDVLCAIQVIADLSGAVDEGRKQTDADATTDTTVGG